MALLARRGRFFGPRFILLAVVAVYVVPGVAYLVLSIFLKERKFWAVVAALITASINILLVLLCGIGMAIAVFNTTGNGGADTADIIVAIVFALWVLALAQLIYHLALSFKAIQIVPLEEQRGFAPVMIEPVVAPVPNPPDNMPPA